MTSLFSSASTSASRTHFAAVSKSTISPLRTPREGASPTPRIFTVPSALMSPTTAHTFEVPISRPTTICSLPIGAKWFLHAATCLAGGRLLFGGLFRLAGITRRFSTAHGRRRCFYRSFHRLHKAASHSRSFGGSDFSLLRLGALAWLR